MGKLKQCVACRYCRVQAFIKVSAVMLIGAVTTIVVLFDGRV
jgi:hypothetical protein